MFLLVQANEWYIWYNGTMVHDLTSENQECVTVIEDIFGNRTREIVESVLDESSAEVTTGYVAKKLIKRSKCENCKILLKAGDVDIANDVYTVPFL